MGSDISATHELRGGRFGTLAGVHWDLGKKVRGQKEAGAGLCRAAQRWVPQAPALGQQLDAHTKKGGVEVRWRAGGEYRRSAYVARYAGGRAGGEANQLRCARRSW